MTDPIADFLTRIRNGIMARKASIDVPASKVKKVLAGLLVAEGFILSVTESGDEKQGVLTLALRWDAARKSAISGIRRVSKPGQREYKHSDQIAKIRGGLGTSFVSTSKGMMTDRDARKQGVGGEIICEVW